jgi:hypothetical protein
MAFGLIFNGQLTFFDVLTYHRKWANALLASAILWVSSFFFTDAPRLLAASMSSAASFFGHSFFRPLARIADDPPNAQRGSPRRTNFSRHLIGRTADAPGFNFNQRPHIIYGLFENLKRRLLGFIFHDAKSIVQQRLGGTFFAVSHDAVDEF